MDALEQIRHAEEEAARLRQEAREQADEILIKEQKSASSQATEIIAKAKFDASEHIKAKEEEANAEAARIHKKGEVENERLTELADSNKEKAVRLTLSFL